MRDITRALSIVLVKVCTHIEVPRLDEMLANGYKATLKRYILDFALLQSIHVDMNPICFPMSAAA